MASFQNPALIRWACYKAAGDGLYWPRYPNGDKPFPGIFADAEADTSGAGTLSVRKPLSAAATAGSGAAGVLSGGGAGKSKVWKPAVRGRFFGYASMGTLTSNVQTTLQNIFNRDPAGALKGIVVSPTLAQIMSATTRGDVTPGINLLQPYVTFLKGLNPPRDLTVALNGLGNGWSARTGGMNSPNFLSTFCPTFMNDPAYSGGEIHYVNGAPLDRPYLRIDNPNVLQVIVEAIAGLNAHFGPDTSVGGIYRYDPLQEISIAVGAGVSPTNIANNFPTFCKNLAAAAPQCPIFIKPTYAATDGSANMQKIVQAMFDNHISMGCEDMANGRNDYGMKMFLGVFPSLMYNHAIAHGGKSDWDFHGNVDDAELESRTSQTTALPPAVYGSGKWYDKSSAGDPGMWTVVNTYQITHVDIYMSGSGGPPVNRCPPNVLSGTAPNPTPGPGQGLTSSRPDMLDVFKGDTSFVGIEANTGPGHGVSMAQTTYPFGYP